MAFSYRDFYSLKPALRNLKELKLELAQLISKINEVERINYSDFELKQGIWIESSALEIWFFTYSKVNFRRDGKIESYSILDGNLHITGEYVNGNLVGNLLFLDADGEVYKAVEDIQLNNKAVKRTRVVPSDIRFDLIEEKHIFKYRGRVKYFGENGVINNRGEEVIPIQYDEVYRENDYFILGSADSDFRLSYGLADKQGVVLITPQYRSLEVGSENIFIASERGKYGLINDKNEVLVSFQYQSIRKHKGVLITRKNEKEEIISVQKPAVPQLYYDQLKFMENNLIMVKKDNLFGLVDGAGNPITSVKYHKIFPFKNGLAKIYLESFSEGFGDTPDHHIKSGYISKAGTEYFDFRE